MVTMHNLLTRCLPMSRSLSLKLKICSSHLTKCLLFKSQVFQPRISPCYHLHARSYSQEASDQAPGQTKRQTKHEFEIGGENYGALRCSDELIDLIVSEIISTSKAFVAEGLKYDVLELGAGRGEITGRLIKKLPGNIKYMASDPLENYLAMLKSKGLNTDVALATADSIPVEDKSVGTVICAQSLHRFSEQKSMKSIGRVLVPGGKLILAWNTQLLADKLIPVLCEKMKPPVERVDGFINNIMNITEWRHRIDVSHDFKLLWSKTVPDTNVNGDLETIMAAVTTVSAYRSLPEGERNDYVRKLQWILVNWFGVDVDITMLNTTELFVYIAV